MPKISRGYMQRKSCMQHLKFLRAFAVWGSKHETGRPRDGCRFRDNFLLIGKLFSRRHFPLLLFSPSFVALQSFHASGTRHYSYTRSRLILRC